MPTPLAACAIINDPHSNSSVFGPLKERDVNTLDEIFLEGMLFYAYHGVNSEERIQGQRFIVDLALETDTRAAGETDDLTKTVNYSKVYDVVRLIVEGEPKRLIEALAETIAAAVLGQFPATQSVVVTVRKPEVAIKGSILDAAGVRIRRSRMTGEAR